MYVLRSKKTKIDCGWSINLWRTGGFEIVEDGSGIPTQTKVLAGIEQETGLNLMTGAPKPAAEAPGMGQPLGIITPAPVSTPAPEVLNTSVTDAPVPANVPTSVFAEGVGGDAEDNS